MRTFPKQLAELQRRVEAHGQVLRGQSRDELIALGAGVAEQWDVAGRAALVAVIVEPREADSIRVVVQAFMPSKWLPFVSSVALDGFYQLSSGAIGPIPAEEWREFD